MSLKNTRSTRSRTRSIATQLCLMYAISALGLIGVVEGLQFWLHVSHTRAADTRFLANKVRILRTALSQYPEDSKLLREEVWWQGESRRFSEFYVRVLDPQGHTLIQTPGMNRRLSADIFPALRIGENPRITSVQLRVANRPYAVATTWAKVGGFDKKCTLQVAVDRTYEQNSIGRHRRRMIYILALGLVVTSLMGYAVARRGLRPVRDIAEVVQQIGATNLDQRVGSHRWPTELEAFASSFDGMLDRLRDSFDRLSRFTADVAHELRTPLNNLRNEAEVSLSRSRSAEDYRETIESSLEEYERLGSIVDSLLFLARSDAVNTLVERAELDGRKIIEEVVEFYDAIAEDQGVEVTCRGEATINADPVLLRRAISNLLSNALQHTSTEGEIVLTVEQQDNKSVIVRVSDTGRGIDPEHLPYVLDRFYRADRSRAEGSHGFGLGLAIVKSIMDLHGGAISIDSEVGRGTTATLVFPA